MIYEALYHAPQIWQEYTSGGKEIAVKQQDSMIFRGSSNRPGRQQDSGWSYLVCACATFAQAVNMGLVINYGVLFPVIIKRFNSSRQETAWIGSLCLGLVFLAGPVAASITEKLNCRLVSIIGAATFTVGLLLTSFAKSIIIYYFTYSLIVGFGACCIRTSSFLVVAQYFHRQKPFATGMLTAGAGMGMFLVAPLIQTLLDNFGLHNTFRFLAGIVFVSGFSALVYDPNVEETDPKYSAQLELDDENNETGGKMKIVDCSVWRVPTFTVFSLVFMLNCAGTYVPFIHLVEYAQERGISSDRSFHLLMTTGLASCIGRLVAGFVCNLKFVNPRYVFQVSSFVTAVSVILFTVVPSYGLFVFLSALFGVAQGAVTATSNLIFLTCVDNKRRASAFGLASCLTSLAILTSPPFAGFLADELESYAPAFYFAGGGLVVCTLLPFLLLCIKESEVKDLN